MTKAEVKAAIDEISKCTGYSAGILLEQERNPVTLRVVHFWRCIYSINGVDYYTEDNDPENAVEAALRHVLETIEKAPE